MILREITGLKEQTIVCNKVPLGSECSLDSSSWVSLPVTCISLARVVRTSEKSSLYFESIIS